MRAMSLLFAASMFACDGEASPATKAGPDDTSTAELDDDASMDPDDDTAGDTEPDPEALADDTADRLAVWLEGDYDSLDQEAANYSYYGILLRMCRVDLPELGERVLYVEQALADEPNQPYRQRLYRVVPIDASSAVSEVWQARRPGTERDLVGLCDDPTALELVVDDFEERPGCGVTMVWDGAGFSGSTDEDACESTLNGATYATAEVELTPELLTSWDRGYDADGAQVWGAVDGAYEFVRRSSPPSAE